MFERCQIVLTRASLVANIIAGELVAPARRTAVFGMLQGSFMLGQGIGYLSKLPPLALCSLLHAKLK